MHLWEVLQHMAFIWQMTTASSLKPRGRVHDFDFCNFLSFLLVPLFPDILYLNTDEQQSAWPVGIMQCLGKENKAL